VATIAEALRDATARLQHRAEARLEAEVLLAHVLGKARSHLHAWPDAALEPAQLVRYRDLVGQRAAGRPVAHLTCQREFWSLTLSISSDTLIPRPETETLVEQALALLPGGSGLAVADLGTGSGAIALALASERRHWRLLAVDRSMACLAVARANAQRLDLGNVAFLQGNWCDALATHSLDAIVSNPPYVAAADPHLDQGDVRFEPRSALVAGERGLDDLLRLIDTAPRVLKPGGWLLVEHGADQGKALQERLKACHFRHITLIQDLAGRDRVSAAQARA
jgi:release factor glutamine methyltransferase